MRERTLGVVLAMILLVGSACGGEEVEAVGEDCLATVAAHMDAEYLEEHDASLIEIGAGRRDLVAAIALACSESSPDASVSEVAEEAVRNLRPEPLPPEM